MTFTLRSPGRSRTRSFLRYPPPDAEDFACFGWTSCDARERSFERIEFEEWGQDSMRRSDEIIFTSKGAFHRGFAYRNKTWNWPRKEWRLQIAEGAGAFIQF